MYSLSQLSSLSILPTLLALIDRNQESVKSNLDQDTFFSYHLIKKIHSFRFQVASILSTTLAAEACILFFPEAPDPKIGPFAIR